MKDTSFDHKNDAGERREGRRRWMRFDINSNLEIDLLLKGAARGSIAERLQSYGSCATL